MMPDNTTMIERVARAIEPVWFGEVLYMKDWGDGRIILSHPLDNFPLQHESYQNKAIEKARSAIEAMMVPTPEMVAAYWRDMPLSIYIDEQDEQAAKQHISSVTKAALEEKE